MPLKVARVVISLECLEQALGLNISDICICQASVDYTHYGNYGLQLLLEGEGLSDVFCVTEGKKIREATLLLTKHGDGTSRTEIKAVS